MTQCCPKCGAPLKPTWRAPAVWCRCGLRVPLKRPSVAPLTRREIIGYLLTLASSAVNLLKSRQVVVQLVSGGGGSRVFVASLGIATITAGTRTDSTSPPNPALLTVDPGGPICRASLPVSVRRKLWEMRVHPLQVDAVAAGRAKWNHLVFPRTPDGWIA